MTSELNKDMIILDWIYYVKDVNHGYLIHQKLVGVIFGLYQ
jgi:hypothetical protein